MPKNDTVIKKEILDRVEKRAYEFENNYASCAQCSLAAIQEAFGLEDSTLAKAASLLSGGVGRMYHTCGALTGAVLALGMKYGRDPSLLKKPFEEGQEIQLGQYEVATKLCKWFEREFGTMVCRELRRSYLRTEFRREVPWENECLERLNSRKHCAEIVSKTARRAAALLQNPNLSILDKV
jgi:C_GCAxxG_C_C family probable redox protein